MSFLPSLAVSAPLGRYHHEVKASSLCYLSMTGLVKVKLSTPAEVAPVTPYLGLFYVASTVTVACSLPALPTLWALS